MRLLRERPQIPFGIHLTLVRDKPNHRWGPAAAKSGGPSLLDPNTNELYWTRRRPSAPRSLRRQT